MSTEKLVHALLRVLRAEQEEAEEKVRYSGNDWGYHGFPWFEASRKAEAAFEEALDEVIDARVHAALREAELHRPSSENP